MFENAFGEVERNTNAIMEELMNKADLQNIFFFGEVVIGYYL